MQAILHQLGELVLGSIPTVCLFLLLLAAYAVLVRRPLERVLLERHAQTGGAMDSAHAAIEASERKTAEYESRLREARAEIFAARASRQKASAVARDKALADARSDAQHRIQVARESVEAAGVETRRQLEQGAESLAGQIRAALLRRDGTQTGAHA